MLKIKIVCGVVKCFKKIGKGGFKYKYVNLCYILIKKVIKCKCYLCLKVMVFKGDLGLVIVCLLYV